MKAEDTPQIIEKAFVSIDTSKLAQLKSGSFWKEQFCAALNLIPCIGGALAQEIQTIGNYKDAELFRKLYVYIYNLADTNEYDRQKFSNDIEQKSRDDAGNVLMGMIDRMDNINKQKILANLTKARINDQISIEDFFRLSNMLEKIPYVDLESLPNYIEDYYDYSGVSELLYTTGVLQQSVIDANGEDRYILSKLGRLLLFHGLNIDVPANQQSTSRQINASNTIGFEEISKDEIDKMFQSKIDEIEYDKSDQGMFDLDLSKGK